MSITQKERRHIASLVALFEEHRDGMLHTFSEQLRGLLVNPGNGLAEHVHSFKSRIKESSHLREKLERKLLEAKKENKPFRITRDNLFTKVNDLVGIRILHLHRRQLSAIDDKIQELLSEAKFNILEGPFARTWDDESQEYFKTIGIKTRASGQSMYTSVHYIVDSNSRTRYTAEIQVRTLAEELWGEVAHVIDYPKPTKSVACREQLRVLARVASSCTRLVDAIFHTHSEFVRQRRAR